MPGAFLSDLEPPCVIDEVQYAPELFRALKARVDADEGAGPWLLSGSQTFPLMAGVAESLAGRAGVAELLTLSAGECARAGLGNDPMDHLACGGYPAIRSGVADPELWFPSYAATYIERDVRALLNVANLRDFSRFMRSFALLTGRSLSLSDLARDVGVAPNTIKAWISVLVASGIVRLLEPYFRNAGKRLVKAPKVYWMDSGLAAWFMGLRNRGAIEDSPYAGALWETYAFGQIVRSYAAHGEISPDLWYWRTSTGEEVDFVIEAGGRYTLIEAKLGEAPGSEATKGFMAFRDYYGAPSVDGSWVVAPTRASYSLDDGSIVHSFVEPPDLP
jgi:predicted AAA+ superfamily ATPase